MGKPQQDLLDKITTLLQDSLPPLVDFEQLCGLYTRKKVNTMNEQLQQLENEGYISFNREEFGWRINLPDVDKQKKTLSMYRASERAVEKVAMY